jgi:hypothetical protein
MFDDNESQKLTSKYIDKIIALGNSVSFRDWQRYRNFKDVNSSEEELRHLAKAGYGEITLTPNTGNGRESWKFDLCNMTQP